MNVTSPDSLQSSGSNNGASSLTQIEGHDYEFDPALDDKFVCPICFSHLREPYQTNCGHRFCRECILRWLRNSDKRCPIDNESLSEQEIFPDNFAKREILGCRVKCVNRKAGCEIVIPLRHLKAHLAECPFTLKPCPNSCTYILHQREIEEHLEKHCYFRLVKCLKCHCSLKAVELEDHATKCPKSVVYCHHCKAELMRDEMENHIHNLCEKVVVLCPLHTFGCHTKTERGKLNDHLMMDVPAHTKQLSQIVSSMTNHFGNMASRLSQNDVEVAQNHFSKLFELSGSLSQLEISDQPSNISQATYNSKLFEGSNSNASSLKSWNFSNMVSDTHGHGTNLSMDKSPQSSFHSVTSQSNHMHSCPPIVSTPLPHEILDDRNGLLPATSPPYPMHRNLSHPPSADKDQAFPLCSQYAATKATPESSSHSMLHNNSGSVMPPFSVCSSTPKHFHPNGNSQPYPQDRQSKAETDIQRFVSILQEHCIQQRENMARQNQVVENLQRQITYLQKSNQDLVRQVKDLESQRSYFDSRTHCGEFYWHISEYNELRKKASLGETTILHSNPFLTGPWGYKLCIRANISGLVNNESEHYLSLFIHFMHGSNNSLLRWPFKGQIILSVMDQSDLHSDRHHITETLEAKPDLEAFRKPASDRNHKGFGFTEFVTLSVLEKGSFIRDNTIIIKAQVFPEN